MFTPKYRIVSNYDEIIETETFRAARKILLKLRNDEGTRNWPYVILNLETNTAWTLTDEYKRRNELHLAGIRARGAKIFDAIDAMSEHKTIHPTAINVYKFASDMYSCF